MKLKQLPRWMRFVAYSLKNHWLESAVVLMVVSIITSACFGGAQRAVQAPLLNLAGVVLCMVGYVLVRVAMYLWDEFTEYEQRVVDAVSKRMK